MQSEFDSGGKHNRDQSNPTYSSKQQNKHCCCSVAPVLLSPSNPPKRFRAGAALRRHVLAGNRRCETLHAVSAPAQDVSPFHVLRLRTESGASLCRTITNQ